MLTVRMSGLELIALVKALKTADKEVLKRITEYDAENTITIDEKDNNIQVSIKCELERFDE